MLVSGKVAPNVGLNESIASRFEKNWSILDFFLFLGGVGVTFAFFPSV